MKNSLIKNVEIVFVNLITLTRLIGAIALPFIYCFKGAGNCALITLILFATDAIDGFLARTLHCSTFFGSMIDAISDKLLTNSVLIILACAGKISTIVTVVIVMRDIIVDSIKMVVGNKGAAVAAIGIAKVKTATLMVGIILTLFYNLPFELIPLRVSDFLLAVAAILSVLSGIKYYIMAKPYLKDR